MPSNLFQRIFLSKIERWAFEEVQSRWCNFFLILSHRSHPTALEKSKDTSSKDTSSEVPREFNLVVLVDDSSSMIGNSWWEVANALSQMAGPALNNYDTDGIDIHFLNAMEVGHKLKTSDEVLSLFKKVQPQGTTPLGARLNTLLRNYLDEIEAGKLKNKSKDMKRKIKPIIYVVITDGRPTDKPGSEFNIESVILNTSIRLDEGNFPLDQLGIHIVQIGRSVMVSEYLHRLDNALSTKNGIRCMSMDTTHRVAVIEINAGFKSVTDIPAKAMALVRASTFPHFHIRVTQGHGEQEQDFD
ncbi:hypothetical protein BT96DRAFT_1098210 [Gymnopus androsaceus JB14]|uniref:VWFA domain-containing protein n=1 Tax=Gymnopus androsaceus JB14 TaxID=1447944 RepID=A0A6A4HTJ9_9AGAR|nr:hypothetical protein BT96DRAFT_1098210 [Gymnopus androsaceus JB14]